MEIVFGVLAGIVSGLGMGGGTILIFLLSCFGGMGQQFSQGTNLVFFIPTSIVAVFINVKNRNIEWRSAWCVILFGCVGAVIREFVGYEGFCGEFEEVFCDFFDFYYSL